MTTKHKTKSGGWNVALWISQILLAAMFLMVGFMKTFTPIPELSQTIPMAAEMPGFTRFIGVAELAGGLGLILPSALRILPQLTIIAAYALAVVMVLALLFHLWRGESQAIPTNVVLGLIAGFIGWGRSSKAPVNPRSGDTALAGNH